MVEPEVAAPQAVCCPQCGRDDGLVPYSEQLAPPAPRKQTRPWLGMRPGTRARAKEPLLPRYYCAHCQTIVDPSTGQTLVRL